MPTPPRRLTVVGCSQCKAIGRVARSSAPYSTVSENNSVAAMGLPGR
jgi:hypothetical protein